MPKNDASLDSVSQLLELAQSFEQKGNIQSALETYRHAMSQLDNKSPLKKEIEIIVSNLENRSAHTHAPRRRHPGELAQWWKLGLAFLAGLLLMVIIVIAFKSLSPLPSTASIGQTNTPLFVGSQNTESALEVVPVSQTSSPTTTTYFLTIKVSSVYLRAGPYLTDPEISMEYPKGTQMKILGIYNDWFYVKAPDRKEGWLYQDWVTFDRGLFTGIPIMTPVPTATFPTAPVLTATSKPKRTYP